MPRGTIKATVLIETILAAFEMDEILYELREHCAGLNAGRWDYIFSLHQEVPEPRPTSCCPTGRQVTMTVPFMRAYSELLVKTCHRRGAHAMGGMAAFIPSRRDPAVNERGAGEGARRTSSARRATASTAPGWPIRTWCRWRMAVFDAVLGGRPTSSSRQRDDVKVTAAELLNVPHPRRHDHRGRACGPTSAWRIQYLEAWLRGNGASPSTT